MKATINTHLLDARFDARLTLRQVEALLGHDCACGVGKIERGHRMPSLTTAIQLEIIYQRPLAALFPELYDELRAGINARRASLPTLAVRQGRKAAR